MRRVNDPLFVNNQNALFVNNQNAFLAFSHRRAYKLSYLVSDPPEMYSW